MGISFEGEDIAILENSPDDDDDHDSGSGACGTSADLAPVNTQQNARKRLRLSDGETPASSCTPPPAKAPRLEENSDEELPIIKAPKSRSSRLAAARAKANKKKAAAAAAAAADAERNHVIDDSDNDMEVEFNPKDSDDDSS